MVDAIAKQEGGDSSHQQKKEEAAARQRDEQEAVGYDSRLAFRGFVFSARRKGLTLCISGRGAKH